MRRSILLYLLLFVCAFTSTLSAQTKDSIIISADEAYKINTNLAVDSVKKSKDKPIHLKDSTIINKTEFKPNSTKAVLLTAIVPGLGQIYNRKYWKLPIVYGGLIGIVYAITWNGKYYSDYSDAYRDIVTGEGSSWTNFVSGNTDDLTTDQLNRLSREFKRKKDFYRRNRDLAIISLVGLYALCMIDAYVDAQLHGFNVSPDLSMHMEPMIWLPTGGSKAAFGLRCRITF